MPSPEPSTSKQKVDDEFTANELAQKHDLFKDLDKYNIKQDKTGIIYLSRIPPGMGPTKVKHILSQYGKIGRVYLQRKDGEKNQTKKKADKHHSHNFTEGWVEFKDKKIARSVADLLNARPIGGKKSSKWRDDVWTMKYLPKFKWSMLSEQVAYEASIQSSLLRQHLSQSKKDQASYLRQVEKANKIERHEKRKLQDDNDDNDTNVNDFPRKVQQEPPSKKHRAFAQRKPMKQTKNGNEEPSKSRPKDKNALQNVIDNLL